MFYPIRTICADTKLLAILSVPLRHLPMMTAVDYRLGVQTPIRQAELVYVTIILTIIKL